MRSLGYERVASPDDHIEAGLSQSVVHALPPFVRIRRFNDPVDRLDVKPEGSR
jgi:hypothetical protein